MSKSIDDVKNFWEKNPLFQGETAYSVGSRGYFEQHRSIYISDVFAGDFNPDKYLPKKENQESILDLGCGPGFWTIELGKITSGSVTAADLTRTAVDLTLKRSKIYGLNNIKAEQQNAEKLTFESEKFTHVNCQGVIHHTPNTEACAQEIARVLQPGGTAYVSVYYKNWLLAAWPFISWIGKVLMKMGGGLKGRGREKIFGTSDPNEIVRLYDGDANPIGKCYTKREFVQMLSPHLQVDETFLFFFPARSLPFKMPKIIHRFLDKHLGFMIMAKARK